MALASEQLKIPARRGRILVGTLAFGTLSLFAAGCGYSTHSAVPTDDSSGGTAIVECRSGIVTDGDVQTSSLSVTKVPAAQLPELPGGCSATP
jgi:hypothetical protein